MKIINDFLEQEYFDDLQHHVLSPLWPWYYQNNISLGKTTDVSNYGFTHKLINPDDKGYNVGQLNRFVYDVSQEVGSSNVLRCRMDMTTNRGNNIKLEPHVDLTYSHTTAIFYVNDSDGNTIIYNEMYNQIDQEIDDTQLTIKQEIEPKANRLIIFNGLHLHTGHTPSIHNQRVLINSNFK